MALVPRLEIRQSHSLTLTPQLMQSIRMLQLSHVELNALVEAELETNPLLEREVPDSLEAEAWEDGAADAEVESSTGAGEYEANEDTLRHADRMQSAESIAQSYDTDVENLFPEQHGQDRPEAAQWREGGPTGGADYDIDQFVTARPTLADHLRAQMRLLVADPAERLIANFLIDGLNDQGYLTLDLPGLADQLGAPLETVTAVLKRLQQCEPTGVFARDLGECLAIQLRERNRLDPLMQRLLDNLPLIAAHNLSALAREVGAGREDLSDMLAELRELDPRPGRAFDSAPVEAVVPDVFVREAEGGGWQVELNSEVLPRLLVNNSYFATVRPKLREAADRSFLADCLQSANWLTRSLDQRAQTMLRVAAEIVEQQDGFLLHGITQLRPLTLRTVADAIDMHESTVSRVTSNKYLSTPRGLFEMKYFFTTAIGSSSGGDDHSAETVRHRIRQLIEAESPARVLSDDVIAELLHQQQGIELARRTVAKYREAMNIPSSVIRRRQKRALAGVLA